MLLKLLSEVFLKAFLQVALGRLFLKVSDIMLAMLDYFVRIWGLSTLNAYSRGIKLFVRFLPMML